MARYANKINSEAISAVKLANGDMVEAARKLENESISCEIIDPRTYSPLDEELIFSSVKKTGKVITVEDHNIHSGLGNQVAMHLQKNGISTEVFKNLGTEEYELSGKSNQLYAKAGIDAEGIKKAVLSV